MALNARLLTFTAVGLLGLTFLFFVLSNALPSWASAGDSNFRVSMGIWRFCQTILGTKKCAAIPCPSDTPGVTGCGKLLAARAFMTLACIISGILTIGLLIITQTSDNIKGLLLKFTKALVFVCIVTGIIGVALGISYTTDGGSEVKLSLGAAAILGILAIIINVGGAVVAVLIR